MNADAKDNVLNTDIVIVGTLQVKNLMKYFNVYVEEVNLEKYCLIVIETREVWFLNF